MPAGVALAIVGGLVYMTTVTPVAGRGDYGQWLMASRHYLGAAVPEYRTISDLPPLVPVLLAAIRFVIPDPLVALVVLNTVLVAGLSAGIYLLGHVAIGTPSGGALTLAIGMLVTDRFTELFAFGGVLQLAAVTFMCVAVGAFVHASQGSHLWYRWWLVGCSCIALATLSHVGTGLLALPVGLLAAAFSLTNFRPSGWIGLAKPLVPLFVVFAGIALYWLVVVIPVSQEYVANPASLAYRGIGRLFSGLFGYRPNLAVVAIGALGLVGGSVIEVRQRRLGPFSTLAAWAAVVWGAVAYSTVVGVATDYPRFATVLLPPFVIGSAAVCVWGLISLARAFRVPVHHSSSVLVLTAILVLVATPLSVARHARQASVYEPHDGRAVTAAIQWLDQTLGSRQGTVLTTVRDGKWLEGLSGRPALFSQPVRYAFRPGEWQRSVDADALLRSTSALTNEFFFVKFLETVGQGRLATPTGLLVSANHGGEYVDLMRILATQTQLHTRNSAISLSALRPGGSDPRSTPDSASIRTEWQGDSPRAPQLVRTVELLKDGSTMRLTDVSTAEGITTELRPVDGTRFASVDIQGRRATVCFPDIGNTPPCLAVVAATRHATLDDSPSGGISVTSRGGGRLEINLTALTSGPPPVSLGLLDPSALVAKHNVVAAVLYEQDLSFEWRRRRLEALGFEVAHAAGPYRVMIRDQSPDGQN